MRNLNNTNLKGINGLAKCRIEFSKKRRNNDRLESNVVINDEDKESDVDSYKHNKYQRKRDRSRERDISTDKKRYNNDDNNTERRNICFICKLPGHYAKECILTKDSCYECGEKGHIAKECNAKVREAKVLTENRVKAIFSQQSFYRLIQPEDKLKKAINYLKDNI